MLNAVVFAGPSVPIDTARSILDAEYLPPIARGDIDPLLDRPEPPSAIGIVDGRFLHSLSISPKEVLRALDRGIAVFGSSSMGALRAVECAAWGMVGVGRIFEAYRTGDVDADDEVAMVYDEEHRALSEPLVNMRLALADGVADGLVDPQAAEVFLQAAKSLYFPQRNVRAVLRLIDGAVPGEEHDRLRVFFADHARDIKREDALLLLTAMRDHLTGQRRGDAVLVS